MTELTPEAQAVLTVAADERATGGQLDAAARAYRKSLRPPDPITGYAYKTDAPLTVYQHGQLGREHWQVEVRFVKRVTP